MTKYLCVYANGSEIANVGIFHAESKLDAVRDARIQFNAVGDIKVFELDSLRDGWSYYI